MENIQIWLNSLLDFLSKYLMIDSIGAFIKAIVEIIIIGLVIYKLFGVIRDTRAWQLLKGILILVFIAWFASLLEFNTVSFLLNSTFQFITFAIVVVFQDELKKILERLGNSDLKNFFNDSSQNPRISMENAIDAVAEAACSLSQNDVGGLIVIEREIRLGEVITTGIAINSIITKELLEQIFVPNTPLHDGAVVVRDDKIMAASCLLPLTSNVNLSKELGTRHRAAIGITEISDCVVIVVSEETGKISVTMDGKIRRGFDKESLSNFLKNTLVVVQKPRKRFNFRRGNKK